MTALPMHAASLLIVDGIAVDVADDLLVLRTL